MSQYINEAFKQFRLMEDAEEFPITPEGLDNLGSFMDQAMDDESVVDVIDLEAETEEDLKKSYVGKIICDCNVCHSNIFFNKEDIVIDDEGIVNAEEECPYCMSTDGYTIVGEIKEWSPGVEDEIEDTTIPDDELADEPIEIEDEEEIVEEGLKNKSKSRKLNESMSQKERATQHALYQTMRDLGYSTAAKVFIHFDLKLDDSEIDPYDACGVNINPDDYSITINTNEYSDKKQCAEDIVNALYGKIAYEGEQHNYVEEGLKLDGVKSLRGTKGLRARADKRGVKALRAREDKSGVEELTESMTQKEFATKQALIDELKKEGYDTEAEIFATYDLNIDDTILGSDDNRVKLDKDTHTIKISGNNKERLATLICRELTDFGGAVYPSPKSVRDGMKLGKKLSELTPEERKEFEKQAEEARKERGNWKYEPVDFGGGVFDRRYMDESIEDEVCETHKWYAFGDEGSKEFDTEEEARKYQRFDLAKDYAKLKKRKMGESVEDAITYSIEFDFEPDDIAQILKLKNQLKKHNLQFIDVDEIPSPFVECEVTFRGKKEDIIKFLSSEYYGWTMEEVQDFCPELFDESLTESIEDVTINTEDETMTMTTKDDGGVMVETTPKASEDEFYDDFDMAGADVEAGEEVIAPISDETADEIMNNEENSEEEVVEDEFSDEEVPEEEDVEVGEFDEDIFNELGESYLRRNYNNVSGFKTTQVRVNENLLTVDGVITFKSGNQKKTSFIFESKATKNGKFLFEGYNKQINKGTKAFKMNCSIKDKKIIPESLKYNYTAKNPLQESVKITGTVKAKRK